MSSSLRLGATSALDFLRHALTAAGTVFLVLIGGALVSFFALAVVVSAVAAVVTALVVRSEVSVRPSFDAAVWRRFLRDTLAYGVAAAVGIVYFRVAAVLMSFLSTDLETGYYAAAFRIVETAVTLPFLLVSSALPILARAARDDRTRLRYAMQRLVEVCLIAGVGVTMLLMVGAGVVIAIVAGDDFEPSAAVLRIQAPALIGSFLVAVWSLVLLSLHEHRALLVANLVALVTAILAAAILIPLMGAEGGALSVTIAETVLAVAYIVALRRRHPDMRLDLGILPKLAWAVGVAVVVSAVVPGQEAVAFIAAGVTYAAVVLVSRAVPEELWAALPLGGRGRPGQGRRRT